MTGFARRHAHAPVPPTPAARAAVSKRRGGRQLVQSHHRRRQTPLPWSNDVLPLPAEPSKPSRPSAAATPLRQRGVARQLGVGRIVGCAGCTASDGRAACPLCGKRPVTGPSSADWQQLVLIPFLKRAMHHDDLALEAARVLRDLTGLNLQPPLKPQRRATLGKRRTRC